MPELICVICISHPAEHVIVYRRKPPSPGPVYLPECSVCASEANDDILSKYRRSIITIEEYFISRVMDD